MRRMRITLIVVCLLATAVTIAHAFSPAGLSLRSPSSSAVLETTAACAALLVAALSYGRWRQRRQLVDALTCAAFAELAGGNVLFAVLPIVATPDSVRPSVRLAAIAAGGLSAVLFAAAAFAPDRAEGSGGSTRGDDAGDRRFAPALLLLAVVVLVGLVALVAAAAGGLDGLTTAPSTEATGDTGDLAVRALQVLPALALAAASVGFARRALRSADRFHGWLAVAAALWTAARVNFAFTPARVSEQVTVGDWLRLAAYAVAVIAAASEFTAYWRLTAERAVLEERRRIARDLHDGLAQELAFIATQTRGLAADATQPDPAGTPAKAARTANPAKEAKTAKEAKAAKAAKPGRAAQPTQAADIGVANRLATISRAADRALDESRRAVAALTRPLDEPLDATLAQHAEELGGRMGVRVLLDLEPGVAVSNDTREALVRIAREAITNAGRHGRPTKITVQLASGGRDEAHRRGVWLRIIDDGRGFRVDDPKVYAGDRWGVSGMRERASALGGECTVTSRPYGGTRVEVWVP